MVKPDGVARGLVGSVIRRFEERGFRLVALRLVLPTRELAEQHYAEHQGKPFFPALVEYVTLGPVAAMVFEGEDVVRNSRKMIGQTRPLESEPGTLRGDFCIDPRRNLIHGSDSVDSAKREIALWFKADELVAHSN